MDARDILVDGIEQLALWLDQALDGLTPEQVNWLPEGKTVSIGFHTWHITRTADNITNFVFQQKTPIWLAQGYMERLGLHKTAQGTGMALDDARAMPIADAAALREYGTLVYRDVLAFVKTMTEDFMREVVAIKPLGDMPRWRVCRQVLMTHGFMHLGEIGTNRGLLGLSGAM